MGAPIRKGDWIRPPLSNTRRLRFWAARTRDPGSGEGQGRYSGSETKFGNKEFWGDTYTYDAWDNLLKKTKIGAACAGENLSLTADAHNWIHATGGSDYQYDAAAK